MAFTAIRRKVGISMLFAFVVALYFSVLFSIAAIIEACLFRMDDFRRTQRNDYPAICNVIDSVWSVLHLSFIFDLDDEPICENDAGPTFRHSFPVVQQTHVRVSQPHDRAA